MAPHQARDAPWVVLPLRQIPTASRVARSSMHSVLSTLGLRRDVIADAELVMSELVANAVEHGSADSDGMIEAAWRLTPPRLLVRVRDSGTAAELTPGTLDVGQVRPDVRGRGLAIVDALCDTWSYETDHGGTEVTAELLIR